MKSIRSKSREFVIEKINGEVFIVPIPKDPVKALRGLTKGLFTKSSTELVRELREEWK